MRQVELDVGLEVSRLSFGTASLHHLLTSHKRQELLVYAINCGISHFDTSPYYGFGLAEKELGALADGVRTSITIATKVGIYPPSAARMAVPPWMLKVAGKILPPLSRREVDWSVDRANASFHDSLRRLRRDCVDILFLHEPQPNLLNTDELHTWLLRIQQAGKIRYFGLAGSVSRFAGLLTSPSPLGSVLQLQDSLENKEADLAIQSGRKLQLTYGYFSAAARAGDSFAPEHVLARALARNDSGSVLISTRRKERVKVLTGIADRID